MTTQESKITEQAQVIEGIEAEKTYTAMLIRIGDELSLVVKTDPEIVRSMCKSHGIPEVELPEQLVKGTVNVHVLIATHRDMINGAIEKHFISADTTPTPDCFVSQHQITLVSHPNFEINVPLEARQTTLTLAQRMFPEFSVSLYEEPEAKPLQIPV